jgi:hypothetical protein
VNDLPVKGEMKNIFALSYAIFILFIFNSIHSLVFKNTVYNTPELLNSFLTNDFISLFFGAPVFLISIILLKKKKIIGLTGLSASILFVLYNYIVYLVSVRFIFNIIINSIIVLLCVIAVIKIYLQLDGEKLEKWKLKFKSVKVFAGIINVLGLLFIARAFVNIFYYALGKSVQPLPALAVNIADLIICPIWVFSSFKITFQNRIGYFTGIVSYLNASLLFAGLFIYMLIKPAVSNTQLVLSDIIVIGVMGLTCIVAFVKYFRKIQGGKSFDADSDENKKNQRLESLNRWNKMKK